MRSRITPHCWEHDNFRADFHPLIEVSNILVGQPDTTDETRFPIVSGLFVP